MATMTIEDEIRGCFAAMEVPLAEFRYLHGLYPKWSALSQYGYVLMDGFDTKEQAEQHTLAYYGSRMQLIRQ